MNSQGLFSIGGIASGLDTSGIIDQLMRLERLPVVRLQNTQAALRKTDDAWLQVTGRLTALRSAVDTISRPDRFSNLVSTTSSNTDAVAVSRGIGTTTGSLTFSVERLAAAHQVSITAAAGDAPVAIAEGARLGAGTDDTTWIALDELGESATLAEIAAFVNGKKSGVTASVLKVSDTESRLVLTSAKTGEANALTMEGVGSPVTVQEARDARIVVGEGEHAITVTRSSNTITDLVPGASITLRQTTSAPVTVSSSRDVDGGVAAVKSYVDALNSVIKLLSDATAYNAETKTSGPLQGDANARQLLQTLRAAATAPPGADPTAAGSAFGVGLSLDKTGTVRLDETKLRQALQTDFDAVGRVFGRTAIATSTEATGVIGTSRTAAGTYEVEVTKAAQVARRTGAVFAPPTADQPKTFAIAAGGKTVTVTINTEHTSAEMAAQAIREALAAEGMTGLLDASADAEGRITLQSVRVGSAATFTVTSDDPEDDVWGLVGNETGTNAEAGWRVKGSTDAFTPLSANGDALSAMSGAASGLAFTWTGDTGTFDVAYSPGLGGNMATALAKAEGVGGIVARARGSISSQIKIYQTRIDGFDQRLATRESTLRRQFTAMESALGAMNAQMSWLSSQISSLDGLRPPR